MSYQWRCRNKKSIDLLINRREIRIIKKETIIRVKNIKKGLYWRIEARSKVRNKTKQTLITLKQIRIKK